MKDELDQVLEAMGADPSSRTAHSHLRKFLFLARKRSGNVTWHELRSLLRISLGTQFRYLEEMKQGLLSWGVIEVNGNEIVTYIGMKRKGLMGKPFTDYEAPPE